MLTLLCFGKTDGKPRPLRRGGGRIKKTITRPEMPMLSVLEPARSSSFFDDTIGLFTATGLHGVHVDLADATAILTKSRSCLYWVLCTWFAADIYLQNETFIKVKPTIINLLFAVAVAGGLYFGRPPMKTLLGDVIKLQDEGWRKLTIRWAAFFLFLAILNEIVWRGFSTDSWVAFKTFGIMPLTFLFMRRRSACCRISAPRNISDALHDNLRNPSIFTIHVLGSKTFLGSAFF